MFKQQRELRSLGKILKSHETLPKKSLERLAEQRLAALRFCLTAPGDRISGTLSARPSPQAWPNSGGIGGFSRIAHERASLERLARWHGRGLNGTAHICGSPGGTATPEDLIVAARKVPARESWAVAAPASVIAAAWNHLTRPGDHLWVATAPTWSDLKTPAVRAFGPAGVEFCSMECPSGSAHFQIDRFYPEWDRMDGASVEQELLVTDLDSRLMPQIRIRTGVCWRLSWEVCACGITLPILLA